MRMSTGTKVDVSKKKLCIAFLFLILFCELVDGDFLVDRTRLVISIEGKTISKLYLTS